MVGIEEAELFQGIANVLDTDVRMINAESVACVERITVENQGIEVVLHNEKESA